MWAGCGVIPGGGVTAGPGYDGAGQWGLGVWVNP